MTSRRLRRFLPSFATLFLLGGVLSAQLLPHAMPAVEGERVPGVPGRVLVKLSREAYDRAKVNGEIGRAVFGVAADRFGVVEVRGWINPTLLERATPAYFKRDAAKEYPTASLARIVEVRYSSGDDPWTVVETLEKMGGTVEYAEPVYPRHLFFTPNDPHLATQTYLQTIGAQQAWDIQRGDTSMTIAIIDGGIDLEHPDLHDAIWVNPGESGNGRENNGIDDDNNGLIDDVHGWDFYGSGPGGEDNDPTDYYGHGTHSAGCAAAIGNNGKGIAGVAWGARILPVKVTDDGTSRPDIHNEMQGLLYAAVMGAKVINMSFGGPGRSQAEQEVITFVKNRYDPVMVAAAGNDDDGVDILVYPGAYDGIVSVAATDGQDGPAGFTNYNYRVDIAAPGVNIWATDIAGGYGFDSGTSFSSPITAGAAALVRMLHPNWSAERVEEVLRATSLDIRGNLSDGLRYKMGAGRLDLQAALTVGDTIASARVLSFDVDETVHDSAYMPGEQLRIRAHVRNVLGAASNVTVVITGDNNALSIDKIVCTMGPMAAGEERTTGDTVFGFTVPADAQPNSVLRFLVTVTTPDRSNVESIEVPVARSWGTTRLNDVTLTFTSGGGIGFLGIGSRVRQGDGFAYIPRSGALAGLPFYNLLYNGGLMIGTDAEHISAAVRRGSISMGTDTGFAPRAFYRLVTTGDSSLQTGIARFDDLNRPAAAQVGVDVTMTTEERRQAPMESMVLVRYRLHNVSGHTLSNLHCGIYLDWDVGFDPGYDTSGYDTARRLAWQRSSRLPSGIVAGAALLSNQSPRYSAVDHYVDNISSTFQDSTRWRLLSSPPALLTAATDLGMVIGAGGITLAPDEETTVILVIGAARSLDALNAGVDALQATVGAPRYAALAPTPTLTILPNPVLDEGEIRFTLPAAGEVTLSIYRPDGTEVAVPLDREERSAGEHRVPLRGTALPAGAYLVRLRAGAQTTEKLVVIGR